MNKPLTTAFLLPMTPDNKQAILDMIAKADVNNHILTPYIINRVLVGKASNLAVSYVADATAVMSQTGRWDMILQAQEVTENMMEMLKNPALIPYTQAVMLLTLAMTTGVLDDR